MKSILLWLSLLLVSCAKQISVTKPQRCTEQDYSQHPKAQFYEQELQRFHQNDDAPGTLMAMQKEGEPLWIGVRGKANLGTDANMTACTQFRTGSITKVFTAVVILELKERGKLDLNDVITKHLPELKSKIPASDQITIRQLLNHTSGITDPKNDDPAYISQLTNDPESIGNMSMDERLRRYVYDRPLLFIPGTASHYSNAGYWVLGRIIERITRQSLQEVMQNWIFWPTGMYDTYYEKRNNPNISQGYTYIQENLMEVTRWDAADGDADPSSGIISTAADLIKFSFALFKGKLISLQLVEKMKEIAKTPDCGEDCAYGLGIESWNAGAITGFGKNGTSVGVDANWIFFPKKNACIVLFKNNGNGSYKDFIEEMINE